MCPTLDYGITTGRVVNGSCTLGTLINGTQATLFYYKTFMGLHPDPTWSAPTPVMVEFFESDCSTRTSLTSTLHEFPKHES